MRRYLAGMSSPVRYLARAAVVPAALFAAGALVVLGPWSPLALDAANARYVAGDVEAAIAGYEAVAEGWHFPTTRAEAAMRAGLLQSQQGEVEAAARWLDRATDLEPDPERRAAIRVQLGALLMGTDPARAAAAFDRASIEAQEPRQALAAGHIFERLGDTTRALAAFRRAAAWLGSGRSGYADAVAGMRRVALDGVAAAE